MGEGRDNARRYPPGSSAEVRSNVSGLVAVQAGCSLQRVAERERIAPTTPIASPAGGVGAARRLKGGCPTG